jgi:methionyl-tRNA synthetase
LLSPFLPEPAARLAGQLRLESLLDLKLDQLAWGLIPDGHQTGKPKPVFPRIVIEEE